MFANRRFRDGFLVAMLLLFVFELGRLVWYREFIGIYDYGNLVVVAMLLLNHVAFQYTKTGKTHAIMKQIAIVWTVLGSVYLMTALFHID